jgi:hypothetical protein
LTAGFDEHPGAMNPAGATSAAAQTTINSHCQRCGGEACRPDRGPGQGPPAARIVVDTFPERIINDALGREFEGEKHRPPGITR